MIFQGTDGGTVSELPIEFDFGLLKQHKMGGWEVAAEEEEFFSFTFKVSLHNRFSPDQKVRTQKPGSLNPDFKSSDHKPTGELHYDFMKPSSLRQ